MQVDLVTFHKLYLHAKNMQTWYFATAITIAYYYSYMAIYMFHMINRTLAIATLPHWW